MLLAVMSVLVFVLPLYQLGLGLRNLVNNVRAKATQPSRNIRQWLRGRSGAAMPAWSGPARNGRPRAGVSFSVRTSGYWATV